MKTSLNWIDLNGIGLNWNEFFGQLPKGISFNAETFIYSFISTHSDILTVFRFNVIADGGQQCCVYKYTPKCAIGTNSLLFNTILIQKKKKDNAATNFVCYKARALMKLNISKYLNTTRYPDGRILTRSRRKGPKYCSLHKISGR